MCGNIVLEVAIQAAGERNHWWLSSVLGLACYNIDLTGKVRPFMKQQHKHYGINQLRSDGV